MEGFRAFGWLLVVFLVSAALMMFAYEASSFQPLGYTGMAVFCSILAVGIVLILLATRPTSDQSKAGSGFGEQASTGFVPGFDRDGEPTNPEYARAKLHNHAIARQIAEVGHMRAKLPALEYLEAYTNDPTVPTYGAPPYWKEVGGLPVPLFSNPAFAGIEGRLRLIKSAERDFAASGMPDMAPLMLELMTEDLNIRVREAARKRLIALQRE